MIDPRGRKRVTLQDWPIHYYLFWKKVSWEREKYVNPSGYQLCSVCYLFYICCIYVLIWFGLISFYSLEHPRMRSRVNINNKHMLPNVNISVSSLNTRDLFEPFPIRGEYCGITQLILDWNKRHQFRKWFVSLLWFDKFYIGIFTVRKGGGRVSYRFTFKIKQGIAENDDILLTSRNCI